MNASTDKKNTQVAVMFGFVLLGLLALIYFSFSFHYHDFAADSENNIEKFDKASQTTLSNYTLTMRDKMQIQDIHLESFTKAVEAQMSGRYGDSGAKGLMLWITENNMPYDTTIVNEMASYATAGRAEFKLSQDRKNEYCTDFRKALDRRWSGWWIEHEGFPKKDIKKLCRMILDSDTTEAFEKGVVETIDLKRKG